MNIIKQNFRFYYSKTDIIPTVLDGGSEIILANWPNDKHIYALLVITILSKFQVILMF